jgi:hypothetical protein
MERYEPTLLYDILGITPPVLYNGVQQEPMDGVTIGEVVSPQT